jgi:hypothetical protein
MSDDPHRRLLDMLAGWSDWRGDAPHGRGWVSTVENEAIGELYQAARALEPGTPEQVHAFILARVVPAIMAGLVLPSSSAPRVT